MEEFFRSVSEAAREENIAHIACIMEAILFIFSFKRSFLRTCGQIGDSENLFVFFYFLLYVQRKIMLSRCSHIAV